MIQPKLFKEIKKSIHLVADSPRKAFYRLFLETDGIFFIVRKQWGCTGSKVVKERSLRCNNKEDAYKRYDQLLKQKMNPNRKSKRIYKPKKTLTFN